MSQSLQRTRINRPFNNNNNNNNNNSSLNRMIRDIMLPILRILVWPLQTVAKLLFPPSELDGLSPAVTSKAAQQFVSFLRSVATTLPPAPVPLTTSSSSTHSQSNQQSSANGTTSSQQQQSRPALNDLWMSTGFAAAKAESITNNALLLVYIHSPLHPQSQSFVKRVLLADSFLQFLNQPYINALGVSVHSAQGAQLAHMLQIDAYPFLALLQPSKTSSSSSSLSSSLHWMVRACGPHLLEWSLEGMLSHLSTALTRHEVQVADELARRLQRQEEQELRRQQDEEYQATLRADQERERLRHEEQQKEREAREEEERIIKEQQQVKENALQTARSKVRPEPPTTALAGSFASIRFVLPNGTKLLRRFECDETIASLKAYLYLHFQDNPKLGDHIQPDRIGLSTSFPRKTYNEPHDNELTLKEAHLTPQAVLMVQDLDA